MNKDLQPPWTVSLACAISLAVCMWDIAWVIFDKEVFESLSLLAALLALNTIPLVFTLAAFFKRNWGRIILAVITALGALSVPFVMFLGDEAAGAINAETVLYSLAEIIVTVLLFAPASNKWYRRPCLQPQH